MDGRIFYLKNTLLENIQRNWTISELAKEIDVSAPYLQRLFKMEIGMPPISYLRDMRLEKSRELLENTFKRINTIGFEVGICCESHFTRDFKKKYNLTPSEYRKRYWEKLQAEERPDKIG
jgi:AraC-like DNA-binding protein